jgi:hypothetical protein
MTPPHSQLQADRESCRRDPYLVQSVVRCCQVLRAVQTGKGPVPLHTIAQRTGLPKSLVFRLLCTLSHIGWIEKRDRRYRLLVRVPTASHGVRHAQRQRRQRRQHQSEGGPGADEPRGSTPYEQQMCRERHVR